MKKVNILFTSVGRRVELIQEFKNAANKLGIELTIVGTDIAKDAPALQFCNEAEIVCRIDDDNYINELLELCMKYKIDCLIPTIDTDLIKLSKNKQKFLEKNVKVLISDLDKITLCRDKNLTADYFLELGLKTPFTTNNSKDFDDLVIQRKVNYPAFIKPKDGSSSINAYKVNSYDDLKMYEKKLNDCIIQQFVEGKEYTIDVFCDLNGNPIFITPRERMAVRSGEVLKTKIYQDDRMINEAKTIVKSFKPTGQITIQLIREEKSGDDYFIEINPRFGGGAPLSMKAGANSAEALLRCLLGECIEYEHKKARNNAIYCRFDQSVCTNDGQDI